MSGTQIKNVLMNHVLVKSVSAAIIAGILDNQVNDAGRTDMFYLKKICIIWFFSRRLNRIGSFSGAVINFTFPYDSRHGAVQWQDVRTSSY